MATVSTEISIREATASDADRILDIYRVYITAPNDFTTFEEDEPSIETMMQRISDILSKGFPFFVACSSDSLVVGYCYASTFRTRSSYRFTVETSIYIDPMYQKYGVGTSLMQKLLSKLREQAFKTVVVVLGTPDTAPGSYRLHSKLGFRDIGILKNVGFKHGVWVDRLIMQLEL
jgi:L-amino acid N-acyltransferase YncA